MYDFLRGKIASRAPMSIVLDVSGIGFFIEVPLSTSEAVRGREEVQLWAFHHVREDTEKLFGFATRRERELFIMLQKVNGVGPGVALAILSRASVSDICRAITDEDVKLLKSLKGVGPKTAQRMITELRDRVGHLADERPVAAGVPASRLADDAVQALEVLGCPTRGAESAVEKVMSEKPTAPLEDVVRLALKVVWPGA